MTSNQLKKSVGKTVIALSDEILELQQEYKGTKDGGKLSIKGEKLKKAVEEKKNALKETLSKLEEKPEFIVEENLSKTVQLIKDNIETVERVLKESIVDQSEVEAVRTSAVESIKKLDEKDNKVQVDVESLAKTLSQFDTKQLNEEDRFTSNQLDEELTSIGKYQEDRFKKMTGKMTGKTHHTSSHLV